MPIGWFGCPIMPSATTLHRLGVRRGQTTPPRRHTSGKVHLRARVSRLELLRQQQVSRVMRRVTLRLSRGRWHRWGYRYRRGHTRKRGCSQLYTSSCWPHRCWSRRWTMGPLCSEPRKHRCEFEIYPAFWHQLTREENDCSKQELRQVEARTPHRIQLSHELSSQLLGINGIP